MYSIKRNIRYFIRWLIGLATMILAGYITFILTYNITGNLSEEYSKAPVTNAHQNMTSAYYNDSRSVKYELAINATPKDSKITIDEVGEYDNGMLLKPGVYHVQVDKNGYEPETRTIVIKDSAIKIDIFLKRKMYTLYVKTTPLNANISIVEPYIDFTQGIKLEPGDYLLEVTAKGFETRRELVTIENSSLSYELTLKPESFKHNVTISCKTDSQFPMWLGVWDDLAGPISQDYMLDPGESMSFQFNEFRNFRIGRADGAIVVYNGKRVPIEGPGEVINITFGD